MSGVSKRLFRIMKSPNGASSIPPRSLAPHELMKEPNLAELVRKFKKGCGSYRFRSNPDIYEYTVGRLAHAKQYSAIEDILEAQKGYNDIRRESFSAKLITLYGYAGMFGHALKMFDKLPELNCPRTVKSVTALLGAAHHCKKFGWVLHIFREYPPKFKVELGITGYNIAIGALCHLGLLEDALKMVNEMEGKGLVPDIFTFTIIVGGFYSKRGFMEGERIWNLMLEKAGNKLVLDISSFNLKLFAMIKQGVMSEAVALFQELESKGICPDLTSFNQLIHGYCKKGDVKGATLWYGRLLKRGLKPNPGTFHILVPLLCKSENNCGLAFDISRRMFGKHFVVDETLLQMVVDKLVKESRIDQAMILVEKGKSNSYTQYNISLSASKEQHSSK